MSLFLAKTDPQTYSIEDLARDGLTVWDGVHNALANQAIKAMRPGDDVLIYHSQGETAIVGLAGVASEPRPDINEPKYWVVDMQFVRKLSRPVTLREIKECGLFNDWNLVRQSRLSTMAAPENFRVWLQDKDVL